MFKMNAPSLFCTLTKVITAIALIAANLLYLTNHEPCNHDNLIPRGAHRHPSITMPVAVRIECPSCPRRPLHEN